MTAPRRPRLHPTLGLYCAAAAMAGPFLRRYVGYRARNGKEDPARLAERFGSTSRARPAGPLVWLHAASVGESLSFLPLVEAVVERWPRLALLITTGTVTSARLMAERLPAGAIHQFAPVDRPRWIGAFLDHWRPDFAIRVESELWPATLDAIEARSIPSLLVNARMSRRSARNWQRVPGLARRVLGTFALCLAQTEEDAARLRCLGAPDVRCLGNLKLAAPALPFDAGLLETLGRRCAGRPVWIGASTHDGEEERLAAAHRTIRARLPDALLILVPRHPARGARIAARLRGEGHAVGLRSAHQPPGPEIYVADGLGELGVMYRLAKVGFVGGSLVPHGGQNLLEPARLDCAILHGPHMTNFAEIAGEMARAGGSAQVETDEALADAVAELLTDEAMRSRSCAAAARVAEGKTRILDAVVDAIAPYLDRAHEGAGADA
ncbi:MAG: 3-deoxy-D-manno-octulosonic acid transferase [Defluviicoccus sp.]|nr:3-deoxy-D-manno-octulosonic acid transferase [Defluviicoccus sp.]MDE0384327.1 3-deoxy-D-manno-octulosonic acid transferase [Defluviicoccus sp.]